MWASPLVPCLKSTLCLVGHRWISIFKEGVATAVQLVSTDSSSSEHIRGSSVSLIHLHIGSFLKPADIGETDNVRQVIHVYALTPARRKSSKKIQSGQVRRKTDSIRSRFAERASWSNEERNEFNKLLGFLAGVIWGFSSIVGGHNAALLGIVIWSLVFFGVTSRSREFFGS